MAYAITVGKTSTHVKSETYMNQMHLLTKTENTITNVIFTKTFQSVNSNIVNDKRENKTTSHHYFTNHIGKSQRIIENKSCTRLIKSYWGKFNFWLRSQSPIHYRRSGYKPSPQNITQIACFCDTGNNTRHPGKYTLLGKKKYICYWGRKNTV